MTAHPRIHPARRMLTEAVTAAAERHASKAVVWLAEALLDAYGQKLAEQIADALPGMIRKEHDARVRGASLRTRPDMAQLHHALTVTDTRPLPAFEPAPRRLTGWAWGALVVAGLALGYAAASSLVAMADAATARQIEAGAVEW